MQFFKKGGVLMRAGSSAQTAWQQLENTVCRNRFSDKDRMRRKCPLSSRDDLLNALSCSAQFKIRSEDPRRISALIAQSASVHTTTSDSKISSTRREMLIRCNACSRTVMELFGRTSFDTFRAIRRIANELWALFLSRQKDIFSFSEEKSP